MANPCVVQGFGVSVFTCKKTIKAVLKAEKDDIRAGTYDAGSVIKALEVHSVAADGAPISVALLDNFDDETTSSYNFVVSSFTVKPESIKIIVELLTEDELVLCAVAQSLAIHSSQEKAVEMTLSGVTD